MLWLNQVLIRLSKGIFAYQMLMVCRPLPTADWLLADAVEASLRRIATESLSPAVSLLQGTRIEGYRSGTRGSSVSC